MMINNVAIDRGEPDNQNLKHSKWYLQDKEWHYTDEHLCALDYKDHFNWNYMVMSITRKTCTTTNIYGRTYALFDLGLYVIEYDQ